MKHSILLLSSWVIIHFTLFANNLQVTNLSYVQNGTPGGTVTFTVSWDNSWYLSTTPNNWDAVWVFVKWKLCSDAVTVPYTHGTLSTTKADHTWGTLDPMTTRATTGSVIQGATLEDDGGSVANGIMLRRNSVGSGTVSNTTLTLKVANLPDNTNTISVKVFGIEMVYILEGDFYAGDGVGGAAADGATYRFIGTNAIATPPYSFPVTSAYEIGGSSTTMYFLYSGANVATVSNVPLAWPKGYFGFYMMKYEITESKYAEFLNTLGSAAQAIRFPGNFGSYRNQLQNPSAGVYVAGRPSRAQNWLSWADVSAYLDWSCLRPMTELEYEKAARGANNAPVKQEYAWGSTNITRATNFNSPANENGTETINGNVNYSGQSGAFVGGDAGQGPLRVGIFATTSSTREQAGASYYGVLELSGNVREYVVSLYTSATPAGDGANNTFTRTWGNGAIVTATGLHDAATWPAGTIATNNTGWIYYVGNRGGEFYTVATTYLQVSDRNIIRTQDVTRSYYNGGRGVR